MNGDMDPMDEIRASFFTECEDLLESLLDGLKCLEDGNDRDAETINLVFRAVHSIKGGAGAFGPEALLRFAHRHETVLDEVRCGRMDVTDNAMRLFFQAADHPSDLIRVSRDEGDLPSGRSLELLEQFDHLIGENGPEEEEAIDCKPAGLWLDLDTGGFDLPDLGAPDDLPAGGPASYDICDADFRIFFKPHAALFETGNEPFHLLRALHELGECDVRLILDDLPDLDGLAAETPFIAWDIGIRSQADEADIRSVFEFVEGLCTLEITKPDGGGSGAFDVANDLPPQAAGTASRSQEDGSNRSRMAAKPVVRVERERIERLGNLVRDLVIHQAMLAQTLEQAGLSPHSAAMNGPEEFKRLTRDIQDSVMMIRAQPVKSLFQRMSRIAHGSSSAVGKEVRLIIEGETTEVDKTVIERLSDPLRHMIRNAVGHGLERPETRVAAGKPAQGIVRLSASHKSGRLVIEVSDDGGGINRPRVLEIAIAKGLVPEDAVLTDSEIDTLLFLPGFTTAKEVSDLSGRGVGMDVVRTAIQSLGGKITISSEPGAGTSFTISLPRTLAVLDGMVVEVAGETLVVPLNLVIETLSLCDLKVDMIRPGVMSTSYRTSGAVGSAGSTGRSREAG